MSTEPEQTPLQALIADLGLTMTAEFVPFSQSRNKDSKDRSINWRVAISRKDRPHNVITTDYMQGVAHLPAIMKDKKQRDWSLNVEVEATETGAARLSYKRHKVDPPAIADVLYSLVLDGGAIDAPTFEDWAGEFGYDTDSRSAEQTYRACLEIGLKLRAMLGEENLAKLREAYQDY